MTGVRPEERPSYEDTGQFAAAVEQLADPLSDPLPGRPLIPAAREPQVQEPPMREWEQEPLVQERVQAPIAAPAPDPASDPGTAPEQPATGSPWFRPHDLPEQATSQPAPSPQAPPQQPSPPPASGDGYGRTYDAGYDAGYSEPVTWPIPDAPQWSRTRAEPRTPDDPDDVASAWPAGHAAPGAETGTGAPQQVSPPVAPRVRRRGVPGETAQFPAVRPDGTPGGTPDGTPPGPADGTDQTDANEAAGETHGTGVAPEADGPGPGGRAERRKAAARQGAGHRARGRTASGATEPVPATQTAPLTRLEARRAARAAKDSPAVILSRVIGEVFISVGVLMLLFVTYQLWWTNIRAHQQASGATSALQNQWNSDKQPDKNSDARKAGAFSPGQGFAIMYIPKLDVKAPIAEGVSKHSVLDKGMIGHYTGALKTAMPWDKQGNFALAAHRNTHGEPFRYINQLVPGDKIVVETETTYYTYEMTSALPSTSPSNVTVIQPVPTGSGFTKPGRYITLTTCTPEFTSTYRMIVWGKMVEERPRSEGKPAALPG
ncbi:class E sortase [Streptomyces sp. H10-C2]|uniref:class E sortase n=1 Tax=unclassified Streptomyces TaxID=2593676 RepID=UPI0024BB8BFD|nr:MULTISPECIES: class E sortase [unclassified Streptomyces]MDJ0340245.1 class E sortase [Streptomyces sp. PH10-H1]MDJ0368306.1 class E sortase [Streptomyces sp. H10-C2]